jgi:hypothetical protein
VHPSRRLTPYLLLGALTLGAGLGAGLGLSEGPVTHDATAPTSSTVTTYRGNCAVSTGGNAVGIKCTGGSSSYSSYLSIHFLGTGSACVSNAMKALAKAKPTTASATVKVLRTAVSDCRHQR